MLHSNIKHTRMETTILKMTCPDRPGLIATITEFIFQNKGNIVNLDQHTDKHNGLFFMRVEWELEHFAIARSEVHAAFKEFLVSKGVEGTWKITFSDEKLRMAILVSKEDHCLWDILLRHKSGELHCNIPLVISNHTDLKDIVESFGIPFAHVPITIENKEEGEQRELALLEEHSIDFIVLARYMQILSPDFIRHYPNKIINIHHSFLPAFKGSNPYRQAFERGVKIIGATAHFVSEDLDQGPIIAQNVSHVSSKDDVASLKIKGRDTERIVLAKAVKQYTQERIFVQGERTLIL